MQHDVELKRISIEAALRVSQSPEALLQAARDIYDFLSSPKEEEVAPRAPATPRPSSSENSKGVKPGPSNPWIRESTARTLIPQEKTFQKIVIDLTRTQDKVTGTDVGVAAKYKYPPTANSVLKRLERAGYLRRDGHKVTPLLDISGAPLAGIAAKN